MPLPGGYFVHFPYPPPVFLWVSAISNLPFEIGFFVWTALGLGLAILVLRWAGLSWIVIAAGLLSPAALWNIELGQFGIIGGALLVAGILMARAKPARAGIFIGLLAAKPQIGILVPAFLLGDRNKKAALGFSLSVLGQILLVTWLFGLPLWRDYLHAGPTGAASMLGMGITPGSAQSNGVSVLWMLRSLHMSMPTAWSGQIACTMLSMGAAIWLWRRGGMATGQQLLITVLLSLLATPYGYTDDMVALSLALAMQAQRRQWRIGAIDALCWLWPCFCQPVTEWTGILFTPLVVLLALARSWIEIGHLPARAMPATPRPTGA